MIDVQTLPQTVKRRVVFYLPGFDPMPPNRYRELYRSEAVKQAKVSGYEIKANRISSRDRLSRFEVDANINNQNVHSEFRFLQWNDLVHREMQEPIYQSWRSMLKVARVIGASGALRRLLKLHFPPNIAGLYPFLMIPFQILISIFIAIALCQPIASLNFPFSTASAWILGAIIFWVSVNLWRKLDDQLMAYYMLHDLSFICQEDGYTPKVLRERLEEFKAAMVDATKEDWDEILLVGHSSGAHLAVIILAELIREGKITAKDHVSFLTLGHAIPMVAYLPGARDLRLALRGLSDQDVVKWVDFSAPSDGASFSLHNPVTSSVDVELDCPQPRILSAAFRQSMSDEYYRNLRMRFFRLHFQYLCHFDRPGIYDYFRVTAGPIRLWERFGHLKNTPSLLSGNFNKFTDEAP